MKKRLNIKEKIEGYIRRLQDNEIVNFTMIFTAYLFLAAAVMWVLESSSRDSGFDNFFHSLWFSIVTVTTVGYGDMSPVTVSGKVAAIIIMLLGIGFAGVLTAIITSWFVSANRKREAGLIALKGLENHTVICGWRDDMQEFLLDLLAIHPKLRARDMVVVAPKTRVHDIGQLRRNRELRQLRFVSGTPSDMIVLEHSNVIKADRAVLLTETSSSRQPYEIDSQTVMASITIENMNPKIFTCTELIKHEFQEHLRNAKVEQIVHTEENNLNLLVNTVKYPGYFNIFNSLFSTSTGVLRLDKIPESFVGSEYSIVKKWAIEHSLLPIGVLENTGLPFDRKMEKLIQAQKNPSIENVILKLMNVKKLESNHPVFIPESDFKIDEHSYLITLKQESHKLEEKEKQRRANKRYSSCSDYREKTLLICGWKNRIYDLIDKIIESEKGRRPWSKIILIADINYNEKSEFIRYFKDNKKIEIIQGTPLNLKILSSINLKGVTNALILACDKLGAQQTDSQNILIAMALKKANKKLYIAAEMIDSKNLKYMEMAKVEEPIPLDLFHRTILVNGTRENGINQIISKLLVNKNDGLSTEPVPKEFVGKSYGELLETFLDGDLFPIGLIEQTGNIFNRKLVNIKEAQLQTNIQSSIERLTQTKKLESNSVILFPEKDFIIDSDSHVAFFNTIDSF